MLCDDVGYASRLSMRASRPFHALSTRETRELDNEMHILRAAKLEKGPLFAVVIDFYSDFLH